MAPASGKPKTSKRIEPLDWTKGMLVLCMVAYHSINYSAYRPLAFRFLPFLPPSFVLIAGLVVGSIYTARYNLDSWKPYARLMVRGAKLLLLFTLLNVGYCVLAAHSLAGGLLEFADRASLIFVSGNGRAAIFEVLLPISYFLLLVPVLLWLRSKAVWTTPVCGIGICVLCSVLESRGISSENLTLLSAGILGMTLGLVPMETLDRFARKWTWVGLIYLLYQILRWFIGDIYPVEMFGAVASVLLLYAVACYLDMSAWTGRQMVLFGRYSLLGYLAQIALLQVIVKAVGGKPEHWSGVLVVAGLTTILLYFVVRLVNSLRQRNASMDLIYKFVFA